MSDDTTNAPASWRPADWLKILLEAAARARSGGSAAQGAGGVSDDDFGAAVDQSLAEDRAWWINEEIRTIEEESEMEQVA
jgi:myo-inositol catabolism protein IolC